ncbi:transposase [Streptomyces sp. NPDC002516]
MPIRAAAHAARQRKVITTAANVNDVTQTLALVDGIPSVAGRPGRPRGRPEALLGDKGYDSNANRDELHKRRILTVISRKGPRTSRAWASSATSSSRPSPCSTTSKEARYAGSGSPRTRRLRRDLETPNASPTPPRPCRKHRGGLTR